MCRGAAPGPGGCRGSCRQRDDWFLRHHTVVSGGVFIAAVQRLPAPRLPRRGSQALSGSRAARRPSLQQTPGPRPPGWAPASASSPPRSPCPGARSRGGGRRQAKVLIVLTKMANTHPSHLAAQKERLWECNYPLQERVKYLSGLAMKLISPITRTSLMR